MTKYTLENQTGLVVTAIILDIDYPEEKIQVKLPVSRPLPEPIRFTSSTDI